MDTLKHGACLVAYFSPTMLGLLGMQLHGVPNVLAVGLALQRM